MWQIGYFPFTQKNDLNILNHIVYKPKSIKQSFNLN